MKNVSPGFHGIVSQSGYTSLFKVIRFSTGYEKLMLKLNMGDDIKMEEYSEYWVY
jgi:hypothetical protein